MSAPLGRALIALVPVCVLVAGSVVLIVRRRTVWAWLQLLGAACLLLVDLTHVAEVLRLLPAMRWGEQASAGHYLNLLAAVLGFTLFPLGYLGHALVGRDAR